LSTSSNTGSKLLIKDVKVYKQWKLPS